MKKKYKSFILALILIAIFASPIYAASSQFLTRAQKYYIQFCKLRNLPTSIAINCYLFDKISEVENLVLLQSTDIEDLKNKNSHKDQQILNLQTKNASQDAEIVNLKERIDALENLPNLPKTITFANNFPQPFDSPWIDVQGGYKTMTVFLSISGTISDYAIHYTNDPNLSGYTLQQGVSCGSTICPSVTINIVGKYYRISTGTASGNVTSTAILYP